MFEMNKETLDIQLTKKQWELLNAFNNNAITEILFGWWARWWKTWGICEIINMTCIAYPWIAWLVWRREWDDLRKTSLVTMQKVLRAHWLEEWIDYTLNMQTKELHYTNNSRIFFVPLKQQPTDMEFNFLWGYELTFAFVDEAQENSRKAINVINSRFTEKIKDYWLTGKVILWCNPDKGHLYSDFIRPSKEELFKKWRVFIQSLYKDNPYIDHTKYEESLKNADEVTRQRLLFGNWDYDNNPNKLYTTNMILDMWTNPQAKNGTKFLSCDVARLGWDRIVEMIWDWDHLYKVYIQQYVTTDKTVELIRQLEIEHWIRRSFEVIDSDWIWWWVVDQLRWARWFVNNAQAIQPIEAKYDDTKRVNYKNLKTQCQFKLRELMEKWLVSIDERAFQNDSDKELFIQELENVMLKNVDKEGKIELESKDEMKERIWRSPDLLDAFFMKFYFNIVKHTEEIKKPRQIYMPYVPWQ